MKQALLFALLLASFSLSAQDTLVLNEKIEQLLTLSGSEAQFVGAIDQILEMQRKNPDYSEQLSTEFWDELSKEIHETGYASIKPGLIEIFRNNYTEAEIDHQIAYLSNPLTQQIVAKQQIIMQQSMAVGSEWGQALGVEIVERIFTAIEKKKKD